jgi:hypothetical protein
MQDPKENSKGETQKHTGEKKQGDPGHIGSSNAFEKTENPLSGDPDDISDEKLDELMGEE